MGDIILEYCEEQAAASLMQRVVGTNGGEADADRSAPDLAKQVRLGICPVAADSVNANLTGISKIHDLVQGAVHYHHNCMDEFIEGANDKVYSAGKPTSAGSATVGVYAGLVQAAVTEALQAGSFRAAAATADSIND